MIAVRVGAICSLRTPARVTQLAKEIEMSMSPSANPAAPESRFDDLDRALQLAYKLAYAERQAFNVWHVRRDSESGYEVPPGGRRPDALCVYVRVREVRP